MSISEHVCIVYMAYMHARNTNMTHLTKSNIGCFS